MYSDNYRRSPAGRSNDEFLRRMLGGEVIGKELPVMAAERPVLPEYAEGRRVDCTGNVISNTAPEKEDNADQCPKQVHAPALAMVYAPRQCWRGVLGPMAGLKKGSIFSELVLPFEGCRKIDGTEVNTRK